MKPLLFIALLFTSAALGAMVLFLWMSENGRMTDQRFWNYEFFAMFASLGGIVWMTLAGGHELKILKTGKRRGFEVEKYQ